MAASTTLSGYVSTKEAEVTYGVRLKNEGLEIDWDKTNLARAEIKRNSTEM